MINLELPGLPPPPKKRGRPKTGKAMTAAQRKAKQRRHAVKRVHGAIEEAPLTSLLEEMQAAFRRQSQATAQQILGELARRTALWSEDGPG